MRPQRRQRSQSVHLPHPGAYSRLNLVLKTAALHLIRFRWQIILGLLTMLVLAPYFATGDPPGVDSPTFLHFGWVFEQFLSGSESSLLNDRWWYGGLPYLQAYSPGGYGAAGLLAAVTPMDIASAFKVAMAISLATTVIVVFALGTTLGLKRVNAFLAAVLTLLSYPVLAGIGIFGWLPTMTSMPFALAAYIYVEKWADRGGRREMVIAGVLLGVSLIFHHMTAIGIGLAITVRLTVVAIDSPDRRQDMARSLGLLAASAAGVSAWWAIPFLVNTISVGFEREIPGNWQFSALTFISGLFDRSRIGVETFPSYIGFVQGAVGIGGGIYAMMYRTKMRGAAIATAVLIWFSTGTSLNPMVRIYPLSGLDVSRFAFYSAPFLALLAAGGIQQLSSRYIFPRPRLAAYGILAIALIIPAWDTVETVGSLRPVDEPAFVSESISWLGQNLEPDTRVLAVGYRNWDGFWLPQRAGVRIIDGWYDEGAANWLNVRDYRLMGWLQDVDAVRLHEIMITEDAEYLVVTAWDTTDNPILFKSAVEEHPELFRTEAVLEHSVVYRLQ